MASACPDAEVQSLKSQRRLSSYSVKMGLLMTSQESLENNAAVEFKRLTSLAASKLFPVTIATSENVSMKNRLKEHVPYDHNRVILASLDDSRTMTEDRDYINASFIRGHSSTSGYIATQGPMLGTVEDFWRMIWCQNARLIVMMSRTAEGYQTRSYKYWPEPGECLDVDDILTVSTEWEYEKATHVERKIVLKHETSGETRTVHQLQFLAWPEELDALPCVPSFVSFWKAFVKLHSSDYGPPVVHCSNGTSRTSLLLVMDNVYKQQAHAETVDVFGTVMRLREDRAHGVNTLEQYIFIHYALIEACTSTSHNKEEEDTMDYNKDGNVGNGSDGELSPSCESPGKFKPLPNVDSREDSSMLSKIDEGGNESEDEIDGRRNLEGFVVTPFMENVMKKRTDKGEEQAGDDLLLLGKTPQGVEEEFKVFTSQISTEPPANPAEKGSFIASAIGPNSFVQSVALGRKPNFRRCQSQISIPVENGTIPVICIPLNHPLLRRMSTLKHGKLRHSSSLQDSHIINDVIGVLPREYKKSFLVTIHTRVTSPDFWQVLYDTGSCLVVRIFDGHNNKQSSKFNTIETSDFTLSVLQEKELTKDITETKFTMTPHIQTGSFEEDEVTKERIVKMLSVKWMPHEEQDTLPIPVLLRLFYSMDRWLSHTSTSLVNIHCSPGLSIVGFLCAAYNAVSNLKVKDEADVYIAARIVQDRIPVALTKTQYFQLYNLCDLFKKQQRTWKLKPMFSSMDSQNSSTEEQAH